MLPLTHIVARVCIATVLGSIVGMERERSERAAGLRTHAMVALGSAAFMLASAFGFSDVLGTPSVVLDPSRVSAQIVTGIGFLGAGTIIFQREVVRGLTTAASIWVVAAIGMAVGGGMYVLALGTTILTLCVLAGMKRVETRWFKTRRSQTISLMFDPTRTSVSEIQSAVEAQGHQLNELVIRPREFRDVDKLELVLSRSPQNLGSLIDSLRQLTGVQEISSIR